MRFGDPELTLTPCPACGCAEVFTAVAPPGEREMPLYPVCCRCRCERVSSDIRNCTSGDGQKCTTRLVVGSRFEIRREA